VSPGGASRVALGSIDELELVWSELFGRPRPEKIIGVGLNYRDHADEQGVDPPARPLLFAKWPSSLATEADPIVLPPITSQVDFEAELGVVIGEGAKAAWFTCVNDVSARDLQFGDGQWTRAKSLDSFCPVGPALVSAAEIPDPNALRIGSSLNGETMQDSTTANMIFDVAEIIRFVSEAITLEPGDLIATGTPAGVGVFRKPPVFLRPGDEIAIEIDGIGRLVNRVE
jgi:2-keto-4-pentenoate hydratase/2-oxohepta-3-ene-1,7-dioic acid hydratase in catechol pathway